MRYILQHQPPQTQRNHQRLIYYSHPSHPRHNLKLLHVQKPYRCDGCRKVGVGTKYCCERCDFDLHKDCMFPTTTKVHPFFRNSVFFFRYRQPGSFIRYCDACGDDVRGFGYHCREYGYNLHPCCSNLPRNIQSENVELRLRGNVSLNCSLCHMRVVRRGVTGWSYESTCRNYHYHVSCVEKMALESWRNGHFEHREGDNLALANNIRTLQRIPPRANRFRNSMFMRIAKVVFRVIVSTVLCDPTAGIAGLLYSVLSS
ncbi:hypothetical protein GIB67_001527 [Kingdonia uniflora]|uniref:Phorbol-ester/DAG-type domain-containing protein n=1 Tax=Kingdonia uniflora TaxID=39325 RepID=A0A7J7LZD6_9MAGN|nr:hypothetical protein GIB67_001527 [Kingdonia uniflora]